MHEQEDASAVRSQAIAIVDEVLSASGEETLSVVELFARATTVAQDRLYAQFREERLLAREEVREEVVVDELEGIETEMSGADEEQTEVDTVHMENNNSLPDMDAASPRDGAIDVATAASIKHSVAANMSARRLGRSQSRLSTKTPSWSLSGLVRGPESAPSALLASHAPKAKAIFASSDGRGQWKEAQPAAVSVVHSSTLVKMQGAIKEAESSTAVAASSCAKTMGSDVGASYTFPLPPAWFDGWRGTAKRSAELEADAGFVADCLGVASADTIIAPHGASVGIYSANSFGQSSTQHLWGHTDSVCSVAVEGDVIASGSRDKIIRIWSLSSGACTATLEGCDEMICGLALRSDQLLSSEGKGTSAKGCTARLWSIAAAETLAIFVGHAGPIWSMAFGDGVAVSASHDATARVWPLEATGSTCSIGKLEHPNWVFSVSVEGDLVATGCRDGLVRLWSLSSFVCVRAIDHRAPVPDGSTAGAESELPCAVYSVLLRGGVLVSGGEDHFLRIWSLMSEPNAGVECVAICSHQAVVRGLGVSASGSFLASLGGKKLV
eukprot:CAMPEP_0115877626 /NCGR_PEP_ID=MMETSP0287-20121206/26326_1 /TAXON_ID=412157 /ORGANISM="Chrysochromulina rotalis, Strain UIO044" /LENGTH=553 /DNA_ID=CAMNT_0003333159 /DNA_START=108 /DNA_END=1765 /DNA_ORIENTATION=-